MNRGYFTGSPDSFPCLGWLRADGLSSSSYGPKKLSVPSENTATLPWALFCFTAVTVFWISTAYSRIIEAFPYGGGGYVVATKLLGQKSGVVSGSALLVDYVLTIAVSIAAALGCAFQLSPNGLARLKLPAATITILGLMVLNIRGVRESVLALTPIFIIFLLTHAISILGGIMDMRGNSLQQ